MCFCLLAWWACSLQYMLELVGVPCRVISVWSALNAKISFVPLFLNLQWLINDSVCHIIVQGEFYLVHGMRICSFRYKTVEIVLKARGLGDLWLFFSSSDDILSLGLELLVMPAWLRIHKCLEA